MIQKLKQWAKRLKENISALYLAFVHRDTKWYVKVVALVILAYALSPIDLIPDFIPVLGLLDDIILLPLGILLVIRMIPKPVWQECIQKAQDGVDIDPKYKWLGVIIILIIWLVIIFTIIMRIINWGLLKQTLNRQHKSNNP